MNLKINFKKLFKDDLIKHTIIVFAGSILAGVFNLAYHLVSVRLLTPQDYGTFNALISFVMFTSMAVSPLGTTLTRFFTEYIAKKDFAKIVFVFNKLIKRLFIAACLTAALFFIVSPFLAGFLKTKTLYIFICGGATVIGLFSPPLISVFQSFQKFAVYSFIGIIASLGKLILGGILMFLGWRVLGSLSGFLAGAILPIIAALCFIKGVFKKEIGHIDEKAYIPINLTPIFKYFFPVSVVMFSFTAITTVDVVLVKHFFSPLQAGYYSIAQMVGKIALFLPSALAIVLLPKSTKAHVTNGSSTKLLYKSLFLAGICGFLWTVFAFIFPDFLLNVLTGKLNPISSRLVGLFSLTMSFYALCWIVINYLLATHNLKFVLPLLVITILETAAIYNCHSSFIMILYILLISSIVSLFCSLFVVKHSESKRN
ncbi:MAG: oligosaccharide flippase family protein [Candidatus Omnitrophota bacterium]